MSKGNKIKILIFVLIGCSYWIFGFVYIGGGIIYRKIDTWRYQPTKQFIESKWKRPNYKYRFAVLDYVVNKKLFEGMGKQELLDLLGPPDLELEDGAWQYDTRRPGWRLIDFSGGESGFKI